MVLCPAKVVFLDLAKNLGHSGGMIVGLGGSRRGFADIPLERRGSQNKLIRDDF